MAAVTRGTSMVGLLGFEALAYLVAVFVVLLVAVLLDPVLHRQRQDFFLTAGDRKGAVRTGDIAAVGDHAFVAFGLAALLPFHAFALLSLRLLLLLLLAALLAGLLALEFRHGPPPLPFI